MKGPTTQKERWALAALGAVFLAATGIVGGQHLRRSPDIEVRFPGTAGSRSQALIGDGSVGTTFDETGNEIVVHVLGAVKNPALVRLRGKPRVADAISQCGGLKPDADGAALNLAAPLVDGTQLYVPTKSKQMAAASNPASARIEPPYRSAAKVAPVYAASTRKPEAQNGDLDKGAININTATKADLDRLPGVGPATADKIIAYREQHGGFTSVEELLNVKGIGPKKLADMRPYVRL